MVPAIARITSKAVPRLPLLWATRGQEPRKERRDAIATFATTACLAMFGPILYAQSVTYDFDRSADFARFRTYTWVGGTNLNDQLNHTRIMRAVDAQLTARGFSKVKGVGNPDVLVAYHASFDKNLQINAFGSGPRVGMRSGTATVEEIVVGTLAIDMMDAQTKNIVWRGIATKELDAKASPEKKERNINKAAEKIFKHYPPAAHGTDQGRRTKVQGPVLSPAVHQ